jgi:hypothetical protein
VKPSDEYVLSIQTWRLDDEVKIKSYIIAVDGVIYTQPVHNGIARLLFDEEERKHDV